jgi:hypothetical protein
MAVVAAVHRFDRLVCVATPPPVAAVTSRVGVGSVPAWPVVFAAGAPARGPRALRAATVWPMGVAAGVTTIRTGRTPVWERAAVWASPVSASAGIPARPVRALR